MQFQQTLFEKRQTRTWSRGKEGTRPWKRGKEETRQGLGHEGKAGDDGPLLTLQGDLPRPRHLSLGLSHTGKSLACGSVGECVLRPGMLEMGWEQRWEGRGCPRAAHPLSEPPSQFSLRPFPQNSSKVKGWSRILKLQHQTGSGRGSFKGGDPVSRMQLRKE